MSVAETIEALNYVRPTGQLVLLLQKNHDFPLYPHELSDSIDRKTWDARMKELSQVLHRYWSWVEKTLFAAAFIISIVVPWPLIAAITRHMRDDGNDNNYYGDIVLSSSSSASASPGHSGTPAGSTSSSATATGSSSSSSTPIAAATRMLVRAVASNTSSSNGANPSPTWTDSTGDDGWAGDGYWSDSYTPSMRWTAIGVLLGVLICAWTPWLYVTIRNHRAIKKLIDDWNANDSQLGPQRALEWSINKAPPFSNAKLLMIRLPPSSHQMPSAFHHNAYPPSYGFMRRGSLPGYNDEEAGVGMPAGVVIIDKAGWAAPATTDIALEDDSKKFTIVEDDDDNEAKRTRVERDDDDASKAADKADQESIRGHRRTGSDFSISAGLRRQSRVHNRNNSKGSIDLDQQGDGAVSSTPQIKITRSSRASLPGVRRNSSVSFIEPDSSIDGSGRLE